MNRTAAEARELYVSELERVERVIRFVSRRNGLSADECDEFRSEIHLHLLENDYRVLRQFDGRSAIGTYLTVVIQRFLLDFRDHRWGKWRPSAAARSAGPVAIRLETLMLRDGLSFAEALEVLRTEGVEQSRDEIYSLVARFPMRHGKAAAREVGVVDATNVKTALDPEQEALRSEHGILEDDLAEALRQEMKDLTPEERLVLRMTYVDGHRIADVARVIGMEARQLYRRLEQMKSAFRRGLEARGIETEKVRHLLDRGPERLDLTEILGVRPSHQKGTGEPVRGRGEFA
ncbi:MAG TPA: sigma-70 family RNA polymerase sigma factor [Thermoanaerobaculia bacterium]|nr:sigma-70 family RNA polymerase sigma factor [Thermoanaerobaculia bacterium]